MSISGNAQTASSRRFWDWFAETAPELGVLMERENIPQIASLVQPAVDALEAGIGWEIGPAGPQEWFFALTFNGCPETLERARQILHVAPHVPGWSFLCGKPWRPSWNGEFVLYDSVGAKVRLSSSTWRYRLTGFDHNAFFDIALYADELPPLSASLRQQAAILVVESLLGEEMTLERFDRFSLDTPAPPEMADSLTPVHDLRNHIRHLLAPAD